MYIVLINFVKSICYNKLHNYVYLLNFVYKYTTYTCISVCINLVQVLMCTYVCITCVDQHRPTSMSEEDNLISLDEDCYPEDTSGQHLM